MTLVSITCPDCSEPMHCTVWRECLTTDRDGDRPEYALLVDSNDRDHDACNPDPERVRERALEGRFD